MNRLTLLTAASASIAFVVAACTIVHVPPNQPPPPAPPATAAATQAAPAATPTQTASATPATTGPIRVLKPHQPLGRRFPPVVAQPAKMTGSNMFGAQSGSPAALTGLVYWLSNNPATLPDLDKLNPAVVLYAEVLNSPAREFQEGFPGVDANKLDWFAIKYTGQFVVAQAGDYTFKLISKDGSKAWVDGSIAVDNDGQHAAQPKTAVVKLTAGQHSLRVDYFQGAKGQAAIQLLVTGPDGKEKPWTPAF